MALPELIEIVPLDKPVRAEITVPGSKSITNRALILAALADGEVTLTGALWSEDTQIMVECLQKLGFEIRVENDPEEFCNRTITVKGLGGKIPNAGTIEKPLELFVGNAGTAARFLSAFVCLGNGVYRLSGVARMQERPQAALFLALRELGYRVESENNKLPVKIFGEGPKNGKCKVSIEESSQFASALLLCAKVGNWKVEVVGENAEESPYVAMTSKLMEAFPKNGGTFQIEPDASSGSYFWAADWVLYIRNTNKDLNEITVNNWPSSGWQIDEKYPSLRLFYIEEKMRLKNENGRASVSISRTSDLGDSIMTMIAVSPLIPFQTALAQVIKFIDLGRLRVQECERVRALESELKKCSVKVFDYGRAIQIEEGGLLVTENGDAITDESLETLEIQSVNIDKLHGAEIETYNDHRMAMCFAILGLKVPGIKIKNPACVKKTFPNFFQKLAASPPHGLGAEIWEIKNGQRMRKLSGDDLFAE
jgi:3-phosphoshikimate 1-carboxyvinyltransferase